MIETIEQVKQYFDSNPDGLPDSIVGKGKRNDDLNSIMSYLGMNRQQRRDALSSGVDMDLFMLREDRVSACLTGLNKFEKPPIIDAYTKSLLETKFVEYRCFGLYYPTWLSYDIDAVPVAPPVPVDDDAIHEEPLMGYHLVSERISNFNKFRAQSGMPLISSSDFATLVVFVREAIYILANRLEADLAENIENASPEAIVRWSEVAFSIWSLIGKRGLDIILAYPQLHSNYGLIFARAKAKLAQKAEEKLAAEHVPPPSAAKQDAIETDVSTADSPTTLEEFYLSLQGMLDVALRAPGNKRYGAAIQKFVEANLSSLLAKTTLNADELLAKMREFREVVAMILGRYLLPDHLAQDRMLIYQHIWAAELTNELFNDATTPELESVIIRLQDRVSEARQRYDNCNSLKAVQQTAYDQANDTLLRASSYTSKREAKDQLRTIETVLDAAEEARFDAEGELLTAALPSTVPLEAFECMKTPAHSSGIAVDDLTLDALSELVSDEAFTILMAIDWYGLIIEDSAPANFSDPLPVDVAADTADFVDQEALGQASADILIADDVEQTTDIDPVEVSALNTNSQNKDEGKGQPIQSPVPILVSHSVHGDGPGSQQERLFGSREVDLSAIPHSSIIDNAVIVAAAGAARACEYDPMPVVLLNSAVAHWLSAGDIPRAILTLRLCAEQEVGTIGDSPVLDSDLLDLAYTGLNVGPRPDGIFNDARVRLSVIDSRTIEAQMANKPLRPVVTGLLFAGAFQAALFAGHETNALRVLIDCRDYLDGTLQSLITTLEQMTQRDVRLDFGRLGRLADAKTGQEKLRELHSRLDAVRDRVVHKTTGWAPARKALTDTLQLEEFKQVIDAVMNDDSSMIGHVRSFISKYHRDESVRELMVSQLRAFDVAGLNAVAGQGTSRNFINTVEELRSVCQDWLRLCQGGTDRADEVVRMGDRFMTQAKKAVSSIEADSTKTADIARRAGNRLILMALGRVLEFAQEPITCESTLIRTLLKLPEELLRCRWPEATAGQLLAHHFDDLTALLSTSEQIECLLAAENTSAAQALVDFSDDPSLGAMFAARIAGLHGQLMTKLTERIGVARVTLSVAQQGDVFVDSDEAALYEYQLDTVDELAEEAGRYDSIRPLLDQVGRLISDIQGRLNRQMDGKKAELLDLIHEAQAQSGENAVPVDWQARAQVAIDTYQLPIIDEMIAQLREAISQHSPLLPLAIGHNEEADLFLAEEGQLYAAISLAEKETGNWKSYASLFPSQHKTLRNNLKAVLETLAVWHIGRRMTITVDWAKSLVDILSFVGFNVVDAKPSIIEADGAFRVVNMRVKRTDTARGLPFFDGKYGRGDVCDIRVFVAVGSWTVSSLTACIERTALLHADVLISPEPLSHAKRVELASAMKSLDQAIFHFDPVMAAFIGQRNPAESRALTTWLAIAATWTGYHPYNRGAISIPAHPEMRYGLSQPANRLTKDLAILYGGRQLGKTTILHEGIRQAKLNGMVAGYEAFSRDLAKGDNPDDVYERCRNWVYAAIWKLLYQAGLVSDATGPASTDDKQREISVVLDNPRIDKTLLLCIDEIDPLLEIDALRGFGLFRDLVTLHHKPGSRFKLVIAGLQNVRRFAYVPNLPLNQLGSTLQVTILSSQDAVHLVQEPLAYAGYYFADEMVVQEVLVETNRHPALIQAFCAQLLSYLHRRYALKGVAEPISSVDIHNVAAQPELKRHIRDRFELTLNIDRRYGLMIWGLIAEGVLTGTSQVTASRVLEVVKRWAPEWFASTSEGNIDAYLTEMCGLGVLKAVGERKYALRNPSIIRLIGDSKQAEERLLDLLKSNEEADALLTRRAKDLDPSPFTLRDEQVLLAETVPVKGAKRPKLDLYLISGSPALGLDPDRIRTGIDLLHSLKPNSTRANVDIRLDSQLKNVADFKSAVENLLSKKSDSGSYLIVKITGEQGLDHLLALIDAALQAEANVSRVGSQVKVLFLLFPQAVWECHYRADLLGPLEGRVQRISLRRWTDNALEEQLERVCLPHTAAAIADTMQHTDGWHYAVRRLPEPRKSSKLTSAKANELLRATGVDDAAVPWAIPALRKLQNKDVIEGDEIGLALIEVDEDLFANDATCHAAIDWFVSMGVMLPLPQRGQRNVLRYQVARTIKAALAYHKSTTPAT